MIHFAVRKCQPGTSVRRTSGGVLLCPSGSMTVINGDMPEALEGQVPPPFKSQAMQYRQGVTVQGAMLAWQGALSSS